MRFKSLKKGFKSSFIKSLSLAPHVFILFSIFISNILYPAYAMAQDFDTLVGGESTNETIPVDESEDILEEGISTSIFENDVYTIDKVIEGEEYVYPENENVRVKFNKITEDGNLVIKRVQLTEGQKTSLNTKDNYGWDISSTMSNGTFSYDLTLPNTQGNDIQVKYTEDGNNYESIQTNSIENDRVVINGLDHFTLFVVTNHLPEGISNGNTCTVASIEGICYDTIQKAIDVATSGDTIKVSPGTYNETLLISESKNNISIEAIRDVVPVIIKTTTAVPSTSRIVDIRGSNITFTYFWIDGNSKNYVGVSVSGQENTIENNIIENVLTGIQTTTANTDGNNIIKSNTVRNASVAVSLQNDKNRVEKNAFSNISTEGMGVINSKNSYIIENKFYINTSGVVLKDYSTSADSYVNFSDIINNNQNVFSNLVYITDSTTGNILGNTLYTKIGDAINAANSGNIINVSDGIYNEDLDITKPITLKSINGYTKTTIKGFIQISADNVRIDGFTINNGNIADGRAIAPKGSSGTVITNNKITNAYRGIQGDWYGRPTNLTITNNIFENISYGIAGTEDITNLLVTGNTFRTLQEGIGLGVGVSFTTGKTIDDLLKDNTYDLAGGYAIGDYRSGALVIYQALLTEIVSVTTNKGYYKKGDSLTIKVKVKNTGTIPFEKTTERLAVNIMSPSSGYVSGTFAEYIPFDLPAEETKEFILYTNSQTIPSSWSEGTYTVHTSIYSSRVPKGYLDGGQYRGTPFIVDNQKPTIEILSPDENSIHKDTFEIKVKGSDTVGLNQFVVNLYKTDGGLLKSCVNKNMGGALEDTVTCTINTKDYTDGSYYIKTNVKDLAGNMSQTLSRTFIFDNTSPTGTIDSIYYPIKGISVSSFTTNDNTPILEGTCNDTNIDTVKVTIDGTNERTPICSSNKWRISEPTASLSDGEHTATLTITDKVGNTFTKTQTLFIDTKAPSATHTYYKNRTPITDTKTFVKGVSELSFTAEYIDNLPSSGILKDSYVIFDSNTDGTARTNTAYCGWRNSNNTVMIPYTDAIPFTNCKPTLPDGKYFMYHQVYDNATRQDIPTITQYRDVKGLYFIVDTQAPTSSISIKGNLAETKNLSHNNGWHGNGWYHDFAEVKLNIPIVSTLDPNEKIQYQILNGDVSCADTLTSPVEVISGTDISSTINPLSDGVHTLCYQAKDSAGNLETVNKEVLKLDRTLPEYEISRISGNNYNNVYYINSVAITFDIKGIDTLSGYYRTRYDTSTADKDWNCTGTWTSHQADLSLANPDYTQNLSISGLDDGKYCLKVWVYDDVQNKAWADTNGTSIIHFVIDTKTPQSPSNLSFKDNITGNTISCGSYSNIKTNLTEQWSANTDSDFSHYEYSSFDAPNDKPGIVEKDFDTNYFDSSWWQIPIEGKYSFMVRSVDLAGNKSLWSNKCSINIDWTKPLAPTIESPTEGSYFNSTPILNDWSDVSSDASGIAYYRVEYQYDDNHTFSGAPYRTTTESQRNHMPADNEQGGVKFRVQAFDKAGNEGAWSEYRHYYFDKIAPSIPVISDITLNEGDTIPEIKGTITDTYNIKSLNYQITGLLSTSGTLTPSSETNSWEINISEMIKDALKTQIVDTSLIPEGTYTFTYSATDYAGNTSADKSFNIVVNNVAPSITSLVLSSSTIKEGNELTVIPTFTDPSYILGNTPDDSPWTYNINYGDGTTTSGTQNTPGTFALTHTYTHDATYTISLEICEATDEININLENQCDTSTQSIQVLNDSPIVSLTPLLTTVTQNSDPVVISSSITGGNTPYTYTWTGCVGNGGTTATVSTQTLGTNTCTLTITDNDGDTVTANAVVVVEAPQVLGAATTRKTVTTTTYETLGVGGPEEDILLSQDNTTDPEVKGVNECQDKKTISGYVYIDSNNNGNKENNEKLLKDIEIRIYTKTDTGEETIAQVTTDEEGYWETKVCEGEYFIEVNTESLPNNTSLDSNVKSVSITANTTESTIDFGITDTRNFIQKYWPWLLLGVVSIGLITTIFVTNRNKKEL